YVKDYGSRLLFIAGISRAAAQDPDVSIEGKERTDAIRQRFDRILTAEDTRSRNRAASAATLAHRAEGVGTAGLACPPLLLLVFGAGVARSVAHPVRRAAEAATAVAGGDLSVRLPDTTGPGEIGALTSAFNAMTRALEEHRQELVAQNERLRQSERHKTEL